MGFTSDQSIIKNALSLISLVLIRLLSQTNKLLYCITWDIHYKRRSSDIPKCWVIALYINNWSTTVIIWFKKQYGFTQTIYTNIHSCFCNTKCYRSLQWFICKVQPWIWSSRSLEILSILCCGNGSNIMTLRTGVWRLLLGIESGDLPMISARVYQLITLFLLQTFGQTTDWAV